MQQEGRTFNASIDTTTIKSTSQPQTQLQPSMTSAIASTMLSTVNATTYPYDIAFSSVDQAFVTESESIGHVDKRSAHNALERQRREGLNNKFHELALALPSLQEIRRPSKSMIVAKSLEFVTDAEKREVKFKSQINQLRREHEQLIRQANLSRKRMKKRLEQDHQKQATANSDAKSFSSNKVVNRSMKQASLSPAYTSSSATDSRPKTSMTRKRTRDTTPPLPPQQNNQKLFEDLDVSAASTSNNKRRKRLSPFITNSGVHSATARITDDSTHSSTKSEDQPIRRQSVGTIISSTSTATTSTSSTCSLPIHRTPQPTTLISPSNTFAASSSTDDYPPLCNLIFGQEHIFYNSAFDIISAVPALGTPTIGTSSHSHIQQQQQQQQQPSASIGMHPSSSPQAHISSSEEDIHHLFNSLMQQPSLTSISSPLTNENEYKFAY